MAAEENTQAMTQGEVDPRRLGRNNSGLAENDIADVICILHPSSPAAYRVVEHTARTNSQHVLRREIPSDFQDLDIPDDQTERSGTRMDLEPSSGSANDLALRFSSSVCDPASGFVFGRNPNKCDISLDSTDFQKRVSNTHFRIHLNADGILMLTDMSTNGTIVDGEGVGGKRHPKNPKSRMIGSGSIIEILAVLADDAIKFIVREPSREGFYDRYIANFNKYLKHVATIEESKKGAKDLQVPEGAVRGMIAAPLKGPPNPKQLPRSAPLMRSNYGMHWDGGGHYNCVGILGTGAFATVYVIATVHDGDLFACKELEKRRFVKNGVLDQRLSNEMSIMQSLRHDNIVQYIDYHETDQHLYIIMEYVRCGDLQGYMKSHNTLPEALAKQMTQQILLALRYLHERGITHRDIKPDNILLCSEDPFVVKLTDFGLSKVVRNNDTFLKTFCGTLLYCAPEVFPHYDNYMAGKKPKRRRHGGELPKNHMYGQSVDIWSYAAVLWYCLCGQPPFEGVVDPTGKAMFERIVETSVDTTPLQKAGLSSDCIDLLVKMLTVDPASRPTEQDCLNHPWLNGGVQLASTKDAAAGLGVVFEDGENSHEEVNEKLLKLDPESQDSQENRVLKKQKGESFLPPDSVPKLEAQEEVLLHSLEIVNDVGNEPQHSSSPSKPPRLFGEITNSALRSSGVLGAVPTKALNVPQQRESLGQRGRGYVENMEQLRLQDGQQPIPQQLTESGAVGFESMVRDLHMDSENSNFNSESENYPHISAQNLETPSIDSERAVHADGTPHERQGPFETPRPLTGRSDDVTPRPPQPAVFSRQINLGISPSFFYDPMDPSTHNAEAASKASGIDFTKTNNVMELPDLANTKGDWIQGSTNGSRESERAGQDQQESKAAVALPAQGDTAMEEAAFNTDLDTDGFVKPPPRLGRISSVPGSFVSVNLPLTQRRTTWGRHPHLTFTYPDGEDTRIPKEALDIHFHARGIEDAEASGKDWYSMSGIEAYIRTSTKKGIRVNGELLRDKDANGRPLFGMLRKGDEISIWENKNKNEYLRFSVDIFVGEAARPRGLNETFRVETDLGGRPSAEMQE